MLSWHRWLELQRWALDHVCLDAQTPDDWPLRSSLDANGLRPLQHGDHAVGHSGIYAGLNGIRLMTATRYRWAASDEYQMLDLAWNWLHLRASTRPGRGVRRGEWARMIEALTFASFRLHDQIVSLRHPWREHQPTPRDFFATIERFIVARCAVLILFAGAHYTVVRGFTPTSLLLFDSGRRHWVKRTSIRFDNSTNDAAHTLCPWATVVLHRGC